MITLKQQAVLVTQVTLFAGVVALDTDTVSSEASVDVTCT